jgi:hypothetical protein
MIGRRGEQRRQITTRHQLRNEIRLTSFLTHVVHGYDVWVIAEAGHGLSFSVESFAAGGI